MKLTKNADSDKYIYSGYVSGFDASTQFLLPTGEWGENVTIFGVTDHCVKSVRIRSYCGPYFPAFGLNTERYGVGLRNQSECEKIRTRITPNTATFTQ